MRIAILGLGLIGGSLARALRERAPGSVVVGWSPSGRGPASAVADGVISMAAGSVAEAIRGADLIVLGAPPVASIELLRALAELRHAADASAATITDVVSTKARLIEVADEAGLPFVGGHPMAGRELTGYGAADGSLFLDRPWVVVPGRAARPVDVQRVEWLAGAAGARAIRMTPDEHDAAVAAISHLPLVLAAALVEAVVGEGTGEPRPDWPTARALAASGWRDMTRLARGDVAMGAGIAATNAGPLTARLRDVRDVIDRWIEDLEGTPPADGATPVAGARDAAVSARSVADRVATRLRNARARLEAS